MGNVLKSSLEFGKYCKSQELKFGARFGYLEWYEKSRTLFDEFLKRSLEKWMFVPCDENGNVLEIPNPNKVDYLYYNEKYQQAKERVLFEGFEYESEDNTYWYLKLNGDENPYCIPKIENIEWITRTPDLGKVILLTNNALKTWE